MIKAIETHYNGLHFRSRLEARWAVFFDKMKVPYVYESEGYVIENQCGCDDCNGLNNWWYLPDFYLPSLGCFAEIKGTIESPSNDYYCMLASAIEYGGQLPGVGNSLGSTRGILWLMDVPNPVTIDGETKLDCLPLIQHSKGLYVSDSQFMSGGGLHVENSGYSVYLSGEKLKEAILETTKKSWYIPYVACRHVAISLNDARTARFQKQESE